MRDPYEEDASEPTDSLVLHFYSFDANVGNSRPSCFTHFCPGEVRKIEDDGTEKTIGHFEAVLVDVLGAQRARESVVDVFDVSHTTFRSYEMLYGYPRTRLRTRVTNLLGRWPPPNPNLLLLDRLVLWKEYQGRGTGLRVINSLIQRLGMGVGVVAMLPFPLQLEDSHDDLVVEEALRAGLEGFKLSGRAASRKLRSHYGKLGFVRVPRTDMMVRRP